MTRPTITHDAMHFLTSMHRHNFARVGAYALIRAHLALAPSGRMSRAGIHAALRTNSPFAVQLIDSTFNALFETDTDGLIYSPAVDRTVAQV